MFALEIYTHAASEEEREKVCLMDSKKSNKITDIVRLQRILKKWKKAANAAKTTSATASSSGGGGNRGIKFLKRTLSFTDVSSSSSNDIVPKGFLAVCVGEELKRFVIPTEYLRHEAFEMLLQEAEEEFGFQQEGVLKIPCQVSVFEKILKVVENKKREVIFHSADNNNSRDNGNNNIGYCYSSPSHHAQLCR